MLKRLLGLALCCSLLGLPAFAIEPTQTNPSPSLAFTNDQVAELIHINKTSLPLSSKLKKRYSAYRITVTSEYPHPLHLESASLINGVSGQMAYESVHTTKAWALFGLLLFPIGLVIIGLPILTSINASNGKAEKEGLGYSNQVPTLDLQQGQTSQFTALVPINQTPQITLNFRDRETQQFVHINSN
jgi:hypothetical protein